MLQTIRRWCWCLHFCGHGVVVVLALHFQAAKAHTKDRSGCECERGVFSRYSPLFPLSPSYAQFRVLCFCICFSLLCSNSNKLPQNRWSWLPCCCCCCCCCCCFVFCYVIHSQTHVHTRTQWAGRQTLNFPFSSGNRKQLFAYFCTESDTYMLALRTALPIGSRIPFPVRKQLEVCRCNRYFRQVYDWLSERIFVFLRCERAFL